MKKLRSWCLTDGEHVLPLASAQDHKRVFDNDEGPNTGGMGAYSPAPVVTPEVHERVLREILTPLLNGLKQKNIHYRGLLYVGLMITKAGPKVVEFNARFGDPECQPIMMRLKSDLLPLLEATIDGKLDRSTKLNGTTNRRSASSSPPTAIPAPMTRAKKFPAWTN